MQIEKRLEEMGITIPDYAKTPYPGAKLASMKSHHIVGNVLFLGGHTPTDTDGNTVYAGRLGQDLTVEQGIEAARYTAMNCLGGIRYALGDLDRVVALVRSLNFVVCTPDFYDVYKVSSGATDLFRDVFGEERGVGGRATIGVTSLAKNACFENWLTVEFK
jgi:enamine deaminase RidA (YjgF/YER057c/UK114 family)